MKYHLSVDLDKDKVTLVRAAPGGKDNPLTVECAATWPIPSVNAKDEIPKIIKTILKEHNIREKEVVVVTSASARNNNAFLGKLYLPVMPPNEIRSAVIWEARSLMPFDPRGAIFNYHLEGKTRDRYGVDKIAIFFAAIKVKEARDLTDIIIKAGLIPIGLLHPFSAIALLLKESVLSDTIILLDTGKNGRLLVYKGGKFEFERKIGLGEDDLDQMLTEAGVSTVELPTLKSEYGLLLAEDLSRLSLPEPPVGTQKIRIFTDELAMKTRRALRQWIEEQREEVVEKIYLIGSLAHLRNLAPYLAGKLKLDVVVGDTDSLGLKLSHPEGMATPDLTLLAPAIGGSLDKETGGAFLPSEVRFQRKLARAKIGIRIALALILGSVLLLSFFVRMHSLFLSRKMDTYRAEIVALRAEKIKYIPLEGKKEELRRELSRYHAVTGYGRPIWASALRELTNIIPAGVSLRKMRLSGEEESLFIDGIVLQLGIISPEGVLAQFAEELDGSPFFAGVSLTSIDDYIGEDAGGLPARSFSFRILMRRLPAEALLQEPEVRSQESE